MDHRAYPDEGGNQHALRGRQRGKVGVGSPLVHNSAVQPRAPSGLRYLSLHVRGNATDAVCPCGICLLTQVGGVPLLTTEDRCSMRRVI